MAMSTSFSINNIQSIASNVIYSKSFNSFSIAFASAGILILLYDPVLPYHLSYFS
jgi:hypothetical protein